MKKYIKFGVFLLVLSFLSFFVKFNSTFEVETNVQAKYDGLDCLHKYGGEISEIETGDKNWVGGWVNITSPEGDQYFDSDITWLQSRTMNVSVKSSIGARLSKIKYYIFEPFGDKLCSGTIDNYNKAKQSATFSIVFNKTTPKKGLQLWVEIEDSDGVKADDKGTETFFYIDKESPKLSVKDSNVVTENGSKYLDLKFNASDELSGINRSQIKFKVSKLDGYYSLEEFEMTLGDEPDISMKIPLKDAGEGKFSVFVEVFDKVGNSVTTEDGLFFDTNKPEAGLQLPGSNLPSSPGKVTTTQSWTKTTATTNGSGSIPSKTQITNFAIGDSQKIQCDNDLKTFIKDIWKIVVIIAPILLIIMITVDFLKAVLSSNDDLIKKASTNSIKRTIATLILICLPLLLSTILEFFGLSLCL